MSAQMVEFKQFDTIDIDCEYLDDNTKLPTSLVGVTVVADMRAIYGNMFYPLTATIPDPSTGEFVLSTSDVMAVGNYEVDVLFTNTVTGRRITSDTFPVRIKAGVTIPR